MSKKNVRIYFDGLMIFSFLDKQSDKKFKECRVGILTLAGGHEATLEVTRKMPSHPHHDETSSHIFRHDEIKNFKHLWLYLSQVGDSHPCDFSVKRNRSFDHVFQMGRFYDPKPTPNWDAMRPTLHITTGEFKSAIVNNDDIYRLINVEGVMNLIAPLFHADPTAVKSRLATALDNFTKSHQEVGKLANFFWTDIDVKDDQRLVLAVGDEIAPSIELFSIKPRAEEFIRAKLTNLPSHTASTALLRLARQQESPPDHTHSSGDSSEHHGDHALLQSPMKKTDENKEENRMNFLKRMFHFLHYYDVLKFERGQERFVLLQDDENWIEGGRRRNPRPDPPCDVIEI